MYLGEKSLKEYRISPLTHGSSKDISGKIMGNLKGYSRPLDDRGYLARQLVPS